MKKFVFLFLLVLSGLVSFSQDPQKMYEIAKNYLKEGDYTNAEMLLSNLYGTDTGNLDVRKDLSLCYYYQKDYNKSLNLLRPLIDNESADAQSYIISCNDFKELNQNKELEKLLRSGVKKFPASGQLNNELGALLFRQKNKDAIVFWEMGIENDPKFPKNYYDAARYYNENNDKLWSVLYAEIFLNMDPLNVKNAELKDMLLLNYKKILTEITSGTYSKEKNDFAKKIIKNLRKQSIPSPGEINTATLVMIRTKFIISWFNDNPEKTPFYLFDFYRNLLQEGMFDAYNQWLFGSSENLLQFHKWARLHESEYDSFIRFQKSFLLSFPHGQYYH